MTNQGKGPTYVPKYSLAILTILVTLNLTKKKGSACFVPNMEHLHMLFMKHHSLGS